MIKKIISAVLFLALALWAATACAQDPTLPPELAKKPLREWQLDGITLLLILQVLGRAWTAITARGGLVGIWRAIVFGSSTAATATKTPTGVDVLLLLAFGLAVLLSGCSYMASTTHTYAPDGSGKIVGRTTLRGYAIFDSNTALAKARNQSGYSGPTNAPYAPGTQIAGLNEQAGGAGTNVSSVIEALARGVVSGMK